MSKTTVGRKDDTGKLRWGLLRKSLALPLEAVIRVLMFGANKYGDENWQLVSNPKVRYRDALDRHLAEIDKGVMVDPDTGEHHMAHVATNALFLLWFYLVGAAAATELAGLKHVNGDGVQYRLRPTLAGEDPHGEAGR